MNRDGTKFSKAFKAIGIESVSAAIQQDGFVETLRRLKEEAKLSDVQFSNLFGSVEAAGAALSLTGAQSEKFQEILADMRNGVDDINVAFEKQKSTFNNTFQLLQNKVNKIFTQFGLEVLPAVTDALNDFSQFIDENQNSIDNLIRGFGEVAQVLASTLVSAFQFAVQVGGELVNLIKGLGDAFNELAAVLVGAGVYLTLTNLPLIFVSLKAAVLGLGTGLLQVGVGIKAIGASIASISALNVVFAAIAVTVGVLTYKYLELKKQIQEQIESIDQNIAKNQELKDSFTELGESLGSTIDEAIEARKEFLNISTRIQEEFKKEAELRGELKEIFLGANEDEINAIYDKIDALMEEQRQASQIARAKIDEVVNTEGEIFSHLTEFAQLRKKLGESEFEEQVKIIKLRGGVVDELNQKILKGEIQLTEANLRLIKAFGISNIEIISEIAKVDANTARKRLLIAREAGLKNEDLIKALLQFQQSASDAEV